LRVGCSGAWVGGVGSALGASRAAGMSEEKQPSVLLEHKASLDGSWNFQAQINALKSCGGGGGAGSAGGPPSKDDLTFKESSVKDVTDRGRTEGAARLQKALEIALTEAPPTAPRPAPKALMVKEEVDVRGKVKAHLGALQRLRYDGKTKSRDSAALDILRQLDSLNVSVPCLKDTKIALELNQPCWRGNEVSADVRQYASSLVKQWRTMFRVETGTGEVAMAPAVRSRKCRSRSMDLEECAYGQYQKVAQYMEVVDWTCKIIMADGKVSQGLLAGTLTSKALLTRAVEEVKRLKAHQKHLQRS